MSISPSPAEHPSAAPPAADEIHLPGPTILPLVCAIAITLIVIGTTLTWILSAIGFVVLVVAAVRWVRDTRHSVAALPERHQEQ